MLLDKLDETTKNKALAIAKDLNIDASLFEVLAFHESGANYDAFEKTFGGSGLFGFMPSTLDNILTKYSDKFPNMKLLTKKTDSGVSVNVAPLSYLEQFRLLYYMYKMLGINANNSPKTFSELLLLNYMPSNYYEYKDKGFTVIPDWASSKNPLMGKTSYEIEQNSNKWLKANKLDKFVTNVMKKKKISDVPDDATDKSKKSIKDLEIFTFWLPAAYSLFFILSVLFTFYTIFFKKK